jgi:hypothetical protein
VVSRHVGLSAHSLNCHIAVLVDQLPKRKVGLIKRA